MSNAQMRMWPDGIRPYAARVDNYESDDEDSGDDGEDCRDGMDWSFDDEDESLNVTEYADGLSAWDELGEDFEQEFVENGTLLFAVFIIPSTYRLLLGRPKHQYLRYGYSPSVCTESRFAYD